MQKYDSLNKELTALKKEKGILELLLPFFIHSKLIEEIENNKKLHETINAMEKKLEAKDKLMGIMSKQIIGKPLPNIEGIMLQAQ
jgi:hypothetical protein